MATLVLSTVGTALGGSIGGALGSLIGQSIDRGLFGPGMRKEPRLGDLTVQTSNYGSPIPQIYGAMRVAGTVIWATDLIEEEVIEGGGKGSPERLNYSYSANFAVALSSRPIIGVRRIWADGRLIRGASGDFKVRTRFRLATGSEDQAPDPLISSIEGMAEAPAYRGIALAIFEDLDLSEFGNRIPLLTFEIVADDEPIRLSDLLAEASNGLIEVSDSTPVAGFAAHGSSVGESLDRLIELSGVQLVDRDGALRSPPDGVPVLVGCEELGCEADGPGSARIHRRRSSGTDMPAILSITYYDFDRDYQAGQARASSGGSGTRELQLELPAVLTASEARRLAEQALARRWLAGDMCTLRLPPSRMSLRPGDALQLANTSQVWSARSITIEGMAVVVDAELAQVSIQPLPADAGRPVVEPDLDIGRTHLALFELPPEYDRVGESPVAYVAASNEGRWKSVPVELHLAKQPLPGLAIARRSMIGETQSILDERVPLILDDRSEVIVRLTDPRDILLNADLNALSAGANLALIGDELVQFGRAEQLGTGLFRLSKLLRGRRGTEWAAAAHFSGERFCIIDLSKLRSVPLPASAVGGVVTVTAHGIGDTAPLPQSSRPVGGEAMRPLAPCHFKASRAGTDIFVEWTRRSHRLWAWTDSVGDGVDEFPELYRLTVEGSGGLTMFETPERSMLIAPSQVPGESGQAIHLSVETVGPAALSHAARTTLTL